MQVGFNVADTEEQQGFDALPAGTYLARFKECELKDTKRGDGQYLQIVWEVQEPAQYENRLIWDRLNIHNPNATAQEIGRRMYKQMVTSMGDPMCDDPETLTDQFCMLKLKVRKSEEYGDSNDVAQYSPASEGSARAQAQPRQSAPPKSTSAAPPWQRGRAS